MVPAVHKALLLLQEGHILPLQEDKVLHPLHEVHMLHLQGDREGLELMLHMELQVDLVVLLGDMQGTVER